MIDSHTGNIHLPNGFVITSSLTLDESKQSWFGQGAKPNYIMNEPWNCWFDIDVRMSDAKQTTVGLSFYEQTLISVTIVIYSVFVSEDTMEAGLAVWAMIKRHHEDLLRQDLGEPAVVKADTGEDYPGLNESVYYELPWGKVKSTFDYGGGDSYISIHYVDRPERAR